MDLNYPKYRWYAFVVCFVMAVANGMIMIAPSPIIQPISESLGISLGETSAVVIMTYALGGAIGGVVGGFLIDRVGLALTYILAVIFMIIGLVLAIAAGNMVVLLLLARLIGGIGGGVPNATAPKLASLWFPGKERPVIIGFLGGGLSLGITIGLVFSPQLFVASANWHQAITFVGLLVVPAVILAAVMMKGPKPPVSAGSSPEKELAIGAALFKQAVKLPVFYAGILSIWFYSIIMNVYNDLTPGNIAVDAPAGLGYGPIAAGQMMGLYSLMMLIGAFISGFILHNVFKDNARLFTAISFVVAALFCGSVLLPAVNSSLPTLQVCLIIAGLFNGFPVPLTQAFIALSYPREVQGRIGGMSMGIGFTGGTVGLVISSMLLHTTGNYRASVMICVIAGLLGFVMSLLFKKPNLVTENADDTQSS